jgi:hypothetical protein
MLICSQIENLLSVKILTNKRIMSSELIEIPYNICYSQAKLLVKSAKVFLSIVVSL